ncbi:copper resistance protein CopC [Mycolicibacterium flavescens]|uniref:Copper resistance protein CopC n=1 Tax=Mycolicibacterium flavescens TaxID=1776 RepID=A0A1E3R7A2_MYCFV|nr:copper resistance CopC family protein [Mycolicibacterium flavescens]MCV7282313.1 copper resistance protein CopC [Mycolicibacterium flavescens]ODQ85743.1 copper resistance protein CopC [Mycolicibacterium flavescens]
MKTLAVTVLSLLLLMLSAGPAAAHAVRIASDPADGAELAESPATVSATFNEALQPQFAAMTVVGPDGNLWQDGEPRISGAVLSVDVRPLGPSGTYTVNYRATSADGHVINGSWAFQLTVAGPGTPGAPAAGPQGSSPDGELPVWPFYAGAVVIVAAAAVWAVRRRG